MNTSASIFAYAFSFCAASATFFAPLAAQAVDISSPNEHLYLAQELVANVTPENNEYGSSPNYITWAGLNGETTYTNRTMCNNFVTRNFQVAYDLNNSYFTSWFGKSSPQAKDYHDAIEAENRFTEIFNIANILPGDILAIKYPDGQTSTGHAMIVNKAPVARTATTPVISGTYQYAIEVVDSSQSGHGSTDTRKTATGFEDGAGIGIFRLYTDAAGEITGYSWSTVSASIYYAQDERHLVVGRLDLEQL